MKSLQFELFKQVAIFTLKNDLQLPEGQIEAFERILTENVQLVSEAMINETKKQQEAFQQNKYNKYIQK